MWTSFFSAVLLVSAALLGFTAAASQDVLGDMVHEEIIHSDGTIGHFSYHGSFVPDTDVVTDSFHMKLANDYSIAMESYNTGKRPLATIFPQLPWPGLQAHFQYQNCSCLFGYPILILH